MELMDMGSKDTMGGAVPTEAKQKNKIRYPSLYLDNGKMPDELFSKDTGAMCRLEIIGKVTNKSINERDGKEQKSMTLEIHKMGYIGAAGKKNKDEYLKMNEDERAGYDKEQLSGEDKEEEKEEE